MGINGLTSLLEKCWIKKTIKEPLIIDGSGLYHEILEKNFKNNKERFNIKLLKSVFEQELKKIKQKFRIFKVYRDGMKEPLKRATHKERLIEHYSRNRYWHPLSSIFFNCMICKVFGKNALIIADFEADPEIMDWLNFANKNNSKLNIMSCDSDFYKYLGTKNVEILNYEGFVLDFAKVKHFLNDFYLDNNEWNYALTKFTNDYKQTNLILNKTNLTQQIKNYRDGK